MVLTGKTHTDERGILKYNNEIDLSEVRRIYTIQNANTSYIRGWLGHSVEKRWFTVIKGSFQISYIKLDSEKAPSRYLPQNRIDLSDDGLNYLLLEPGFAFTIQSKVQDSVLLVMSNFPVGITNDELRFPIDYFKIRR
ncbi:sugar epimerase [Arcticibacterium luteifluviistationis]|uniref:Sugar epimerase n=1 Tax=Arcticibacterium luteifluviistationis TaxID=1784714 RepID=A0A2Z4GFL6_9BACT|nr:sugar epimerase [Arcticibacterium luteifluviistationis]AWV99845.1 sugar epimerase [Arcticibacterium luteifluviistationis]